MRNLIRITGLAVMALCTLEAVPAKAESGGMMDKERWQVRVRAIGVFPDVGSSDVNIGGDADVGDAVTPEVDITYFLTDHVAAELIAATAQHQVDYTGNVNLGDTWILPPTVTLQYHFTPDNAFSPYVGAGVNYSLFYGEDSGAGFTDLEVDGGFGFALQGGVDYWLDEHWGLNVDVKKLWLDIDVHLNNGTIRTGDLELDPWIVGTGVSYRF